MKTSALISALVVLGLSTPLFGQGVPLYQHLGANNPAGEGFTLVTSGAGGTTSPVLSDGGVAAWATQAGPGGALWYSSELNSAALAQNSWILSVNMRVVEPATGAQHSFVEVQTGNYTYSFWVAAQSDGDQMVGTGAFASGPFHVLEGSGSVYHDYELHFNPIGSIGGVGELWVDGVAVLPAFTSSGQSGSSALLWGVAQPGPSLSHWHSVSFQVIPEPSSITLFLIGLMLVSRKWPNRGAAAPMRIVSRVEE